MWDELKRTDVKLAMQKLAELRNVTLQRHAEELKQLDSASQSRRSGIGYDTAETEHEGSPPVNLEVRQSVSPNFGSPLRRLVSR